MFDIEKFLLRQYDVIDGQSDWRVDCPFCYDRVGSEDINKHLYISKHRHVVHCFKCDYKANWIGFVMEVTGLTYWHVVGELYQSARIKDWDSIAIEDDIVETSYQELHLPDDFINLRGDRSVTAGMCRRYLKNRGFGVKYIHKYNLGSAASQPFRVIIPIEDGYWQGRSIVKWVEPKYLNPTAEAKHVLFNPAALQYNEAIVCEGAFSAMAVGDNALALIGKNPVAEKVWRLLNSSVERFIVTVEPEGAMSPMTKLADALVRNGKEVVLWVYKTGDPAENEGYDIKAYDFKTRLEMALTKH